MVWFGVAFLRRAIFKKEKRQNIIVVWKTCCQKMTTAICFYMKHFIHEVTSPRHLMV
jgi:hypothetical protein